MTNINIADHNTASILLLRAMLKQSNSSDLSKHFGMTDGNVDVELKVNGVIVPFLEVVEGAYAKLVEEVEEMAKTEALRMVRDTGIQKIQDTLDQAEEEIREILTKAVQEAAKSK